MPRVTGDAARPRALVLAPRALFASFFDAPRERRLRRSFSVSRLEGRTLTPRVLAALAGAQALVTTWDSPTFGDDLPALAPRLRIVAHCGGEVKRRFARPLFERLTITNAPAPMTHYVAELGVAFLLHAARRIDDYRAALRRPSNRVYRDLHDHGARGDTLRERRVGLVGFGRIGRALADLLRPFAPRLLVHDPYAPRGLAARHGAAFVSLRRLLATSEFLVLAAGLTEGTRGMIDADALRLLRDGATVVNVARGGLVDLDALTREVRRGRLRCALDVTDPLEPLPARHPLRRARGAVLTPHVGAATVSVRREIADIVLDDLERFFRGERVRNRVHPAMLDRTT
jgi:phosphoglycerate dehydrogenase-like enzyme